MARNTLRSMPPCHWPTSAATNVILTLMTLQGIVCLVPERYYLFPSNMLLTPLKRFFLQILGSHVALQWFFGFTFIVHGLEAIYTLILIYRTLDGHFGAIQSVLWVLQTVLLGFVSVRQLHRELENFTSYAPGHGK